MGGVGDEATLRVERPFQPSEEPVDGVAQLGELVSGAEEGQTLMEVVLGNFLPIISSSCVRSHAKRVCACG
jgi:hypothetical protein